jgi:hypothetical protein
MFKWCIVVLALFLSTHVYAVRASENSLRGKYTFNWFADPNKTKCMRINGKWTARFMSTQFHCDLKAKNKTASGVPASVCSNKEGSSEYLIFSTLGSCEKERETQAANGD